MEIKWMLLSFVGLMIVFCGVIIAVLRWSLVSSTEGAVDHINKELEDANTKQAEIAKQIREAKEDLEKKRQEAKELAGSMRAIAEEEAKAERERIVGKAREEADEIIEKAKNSREKLQLELEKNMNIKAVTYSIKILNDILSEKVKGSLDEVLVQEYLEKLETVDMGRISPDIQSAEIISLKPLNEQIKNRFSQVIKGKLKREIALNCSTDANIGGGVVLKFGSIALDGSIKSLISEKGTELFEKLET